MSKTLASLLCPAAIAAALLGASAGPASAKTYSVKAIEKHGRSLSFRLDRLPADKIRSARLLRKKRVRQRVSARTVRLAARRGYLRVNTRSRAYRALRRLPRTRGRARAAGPKAKSSRGRWRLVVDVDTAPPDTTIGSGPTGAVASPDASFTFSASESGARFQCRLDGASWGACDSPASYSGLADGAHVFEVRAVDAAGNVDPTPASRDWTVAASAQAPEAPTSGEPEPEPAPVPEPAPAPLFSDAFSGPDGTITNHHDFWSTQPRGGTLDPNWAVESGLWYRRSETAWTDSQVFRAWSKRTDFRSIRVEFDLRSNRYLESAQYPAVSWDGVKIWLHRKLLDDAGSPAGYTAEVNRRQGNVIIQKKVPGCVDGGQCVQGGTYFLLAQTPTSSHPARFGQWERVGGVVRNNADGSVTIQVIRDGRVVLETTDRGVGGPPLRDGGRFGIRGDNTDFNVDNVTVVPAAG